MTKALLVAVAMLVPGLSQAADLSGRWNVTLSKSSSYEGFVLIDREGRAIWDSPLDGGRPAKFLGAIRYSDASRVEMVMTNRSDVVEINCLAEAVDLLRCHTKYPNGTTSQMYSLARVGPAPAKLTAPR